MHTTSEPSSAPGVVIVGAGPAGLALAVALAASNIPSTVLEQAPISSLADPPEDGRDIALTHRSRRILEALGIWQRLPADEIAPLRRAQVSTGASPWVLPFDARDEGHRALGWLVPNHRIRAACYASALAQPAIRLEGDARVTAFSRDTTGATVWIDAGRAWRAPLVVAADSRFSGLRRLAGIGASMTDFGRTAIVCRMAHEADHGGIAHECFRHGNTLAMLPMAGRQSSAVLTVRADDAAAWLACNDTEFARRTASQFDHRLGAMQVAGKRHCYPLVAVYADTFASPRLALVGDAAVGILSWLSYSPVLETAENKRYIEAFRKKYGKASSYNNHLGYLAAKAGGEALKAVNANVEDQPRFLAALRSVRFEAPGGSFRFDEKQNAIIPTYIRRVDKVAEKLQNTVIDAVHDVDQFWKPPRR
jgi:ubiquinone biosynthesis UbiH/UbiF/VisC/COQ6 family hydroxylase